MTSSVIFLTDYLKPSQRTLEISKTCHRNVFIITEIQIPKSGREKEIFLETGTGLIRWTNCILLPFPEICSLSLTRGSLLQELHTLT